MENFRSYGKIHRIGKDETDGILIGRCAIQEKIDGANVSVWLDAESGDLKMGSRTRILRDDEEFNGFVPYIKNHEGIKKLLNDNPNWRLYGEWLVRHTIAYSETSYRKMYLFDIWTGAEYLPSNVVVEVGEKYDIPTVPHHGFFDSPTVDQLAEFVGKTQFGDRGEGIVIKNLDFVNKFGDVVFAKIVTESFKEDNSVVFGGNNKHSETYYEMYVVNKYLTLPRVKKIMDKLQPIINEKLDMKHIPRICGTVFHDMMTEEIGSIIKDVTKLDFKTLQRIAFKKSKQIYVDILNESISIADKKYEK